MDKSDIRMQVEEFMREAAARGGKDDIGQKVLDRPQVPSKEVVVMRLTLILEEVEELVCALGGNRTWPRYIELKSVDLPAVADALADIDYVVEGMRLALGINGAPIAQEVHRANMAKFGSEAQIVYWSEKDDMDPGWYYFDSEYPEEGHVGPFNVRKAAEVHAHENGYVYKREDGKHMKPKGWKPPDIAGELIKQGWSL